MQGKAIPLLVLVAALAVGLASVTWAAGRNDDAWTMKRLGGGMMGYAAGGPGEPVRTLGEARRSAERFAEQFDLSVGEMMRFSNGYYAELEQDGRPATEVLVDPETGAVFLEYGPAMMWNERYGMTSGMMSGAGMMDGSMGGTGMMDGSMGGAGMMDGSAAMGPTVVAPDDRAVSGAEARSIADRWLARSGEGLKAGVAEPFPGYYTLHVLRDAKTAGMISVNASTGAVWYHRWHGRFLSMSG